MRITAKLYEESGYLSSRHSCLQRMEQRWQEGKEFSVVFALWGTLKDPDASKLADPYFVYIRRLEFVKDDDAEDRVKINLRWDKYEMNRMIYLLKDPLHKIIKKLMLVHVDEEIKAKIEPLLAQGFCLRERGQDRVYFVSLQYSSSQLKESNCYFLQGDINYKEKLMKSIGNLVPTAGYLVNVARIASKFGLLFTSFKTAIDVDTFGFEIYEIPDLEYNGYVFTDGCGLMGGMVAEAIAQALGERRIPSVAQVRFAGFKGILTLNPHIPDTHIWFPKSMKKFKWNFGSSEAIAKLGRLLCVCSFSKAPVEAYLTQHTALMLEALGIRSYYPNATINRALYDRKFTTSLSGKKALKGAKLAESANLFGTSDVWVSLARGNNISSGKLRSGQCFIQLENSKGECRVIEGRVLVEKRPNYLHTGVRVLEAVDCPGLRHLKNCIVFSSKEEVPLHAQMPGADLDGDQYFACWDDELIPRQPLPASCVELGTPEAKIVISSFREFHDKYIAHFVSYSPRKIAETNKDFFEICALSKKGPKSKAAISIAVKAHYEICVGKHGGEPSPIPNSHQPEFIKKSREGHIQAAYEKALEEEKAMLCCQVLACIVFLIVAALIVTAIYWLMSRPTHSWSRA